MCRGMSLETNAQSSAEGCGRELGKAVRAPDYQVISYVSFLKQLGLYNLRETCRWRLWLLQGVVMGLGHPVPHAHTGTGYPFCCLMSTPFYPAKSFLKHTWTVQTHTHTRWQPSTLGRNCDLSFGGFREAVSPWDSLGNAHPSVCLTQASRAGPSTGIEEKKSKILQRLSAHSFNIFIVYKCV